LFQEKTKLPITNYYLKKKKSENSIPISQKLWINITYAKDGTFNANLAAQKYKNYFHNIVKKCEPYLLAKIDEGEL
jgi:hypothetical protein